MQLQQRINAFAKLGGFLGQFSNKDIHKKNDIAFIWCTKKCIQRMISFLLLSKKTKIILI